MDADSDFEDFSGEDDVIERPYGTKPYGTKPYGTKPYGTKPYGTKPYGTKPYGTKPYGTKPYGTKPYGTKPYGTRPYGTKPYPSEDALDPGVWTADVAELICECSAVIRLGATIVAGDFELEIPVVNPTADYTGVEKESLAAIGGINVHPLGHQLDALVAVPNRLIAAIAGNAELADALKVDLADAMTLAADTAFLQGSGGEGEPKGILKIIDPGVDPGGDLLESARRVVQSVREHRPIFRNPGWILDPLALDELTKLTTADGLKESGGPGARSLDTFALLKLDGADGGTLLGFPFVMSRAASAEKAATEVAAKEESKKKEAKKTLYFSSDWQEAWVAISGELVTVDIAAEAGFAANQVLIRASMFHDFGLRRPEAFAWVEQP